MKKLYLLLALAVVVTACQKDELIEAPTQRVAAAPADDQTDLPATATNIALLRLQVFLEQLDGPQTRVNSLGGSAGRTIASVEPVVAGTSPVVTKFSTAQPIDPKFNTGTDTMLLVVNFADNKGYAILSTIDFNHPILALIDKGSYSPAKLQTRMTRKLNRINVSSDNPTHFQATDLTSVTGIKDLDQDNLIEDLIVDYTLHVRDSMQLAGVYMPLNPVGRDLLDEMMKPEDEHSCDRPWHGADLQENEKYLKGLVNVIIPGIRIIPNIGAELDIKTEVTQSIKKTTNFWDQTSPYNRYMPKINGMQCKVGSGTVAMATLWAYWKYPTLIATGPKHYSALNWNLMRTVAPGDNPESMGTGAGQDKLAHTLRYIEDYLNTGSTLDGVPPDTSKMAAIMRQVGYRDVKEVSFDDYRCNTDLLAGRPLLLVAKNAKELHSWIIDGAVEYHTQESTIWSNGSVHPWKEYYSVYYYCNWGWGGLYNGYFLSWLFNPDKRVEPGAPNPSTPRDDPGAYRKITRIGYTR